MKKWNTPDVTELNINETANGLIPFVVESPMDIATNDSLLCKPSDKDSDDKDTNQFS